MSRLIFALAMALPCIALAADVPSLPAPDGFSRESIQDVYETLTPAICVLKYSMEITNPSTGEVNRRAGHALGLIVAPDGLILAHGHLLLENRRPNNIKVTIGDDRDTEYNAVILKKPDDINVTFFRIETDDTLDLPYVHFAENKELELGESVMLFGLLRESLDYARGLQMRRIGAILEEPRKTYVLDASTAFGYVGGPVISVAGEVVGVLGFDLSTTEGGDIYTRSGHPLVYQSALFQKYIESPPSDTPSDDAWLGVFTQPLTDNLAKYWGLRQEGGIVVSTVLPGSPADRSGFRPGDVIVNFDGNVVTAKQDQDVAAFTKMVRESPLEEPLSVEFIRDGETTEIKLTLLPRPKSGRDALQIEDDVFGLTLRELTTDARIVMNLSEDVEGLIIRRVKSGSPAALAGLRPGFLVMAVGGRPIRNIEEYTAAIDAQSEVKPREIRVFCRVGSSTAFFRIQPRWEN